MKFKKKLILRFDDEGWGECGGGALADCGKDMFGSSLADERRKRREEDSAGRSLLDNGGWLVTLEKVWEKLHKYFLGMTCDVKFA